MKLPATLVLLGWAPALAAQQPVFPPKTMEQVRRVMRDIYQLEHLEAATRCREMIAAEPDDPAGYVYLARTYWAEELGNERALSIDRFAASDFFTEVPGAKDRLEPEIDARFEEVSAQAIEKSKARLQSHPLLARYLLGVAYQNLASWEFTLKRAWWAAFRLGAKTDRYHRELLRLNPSFADARVTTGVYNYIAGSLSWKVKWLSVFLGYQGTVKKGIEELEIAARDSLVAADDARTILVFVYTREKQYDKAFKKLGEIVARHPQNYLAHLEMAGLALRMNRPEQAVSLYREILAKVEKRRDKYDRLERASVYNRLGVALRATKSLAASAEWFERALREPKLSERSKIVAHLELGKTLDLIGRREEAVRHYQAVLAAPDVAGSRKDAEQLLKRPFK